MEVNKKISTGHNTLYLLICSLRPLQIVTKNMIIFAGILFSGNLFNFGMWFKVIGCYICFAFISGGVYLLNDLNDRESDRFHPIKMQRPIAAGLLSTPKVVPCAVSSLIIGVIGMLYLEIGTGFIAIVYLILMLGYNKKFKLLMIVDCITLAIGFVLRAVAGAMVIQVRISSWFLVSTFYLSLLLAVTKRKNESKKLKEKASQHRATLKSYRGELNDLLIAILTATTLMTYSLYTFTSDQAELLLLTVPLVVYGLFRYLYLIYIKQVTIAVEKLLFVDKPLLITVITWGVLVTTILFLF